MSRDILYMGKMYPILENTLRDSTDQLFEIPFTLAEPKNGNADMALIYVRMTGVLRNRGYKLIDIRWGTRTVVVSKLSQY